MKYTVSVLSISVIIAGITLTISSCNIKKKPAKINGSEYDTNYRRIITAPIVEKNFVQRNGKPKDFTELYLVQSVGDYFIKFRESEVSRKELENKLAQIGSDIKTIKPEVEFREGNWDICEGGPEQQSRTGKYVVVFRVMNNV